MRLGKVIVKHFLTLEIKFAVSFTEGIIHRFAPIVSNINAMAVIFYLSICNSGKF